MADEPGTTSPCYDPTLTYTPPVGRLPVLGKVRAQIDQIRASIAHDAARVINETNKVAAEVERLEVEREKVAAEILGIEAQKLKIDAEIQALEVEKEKIAAEVLRIGVESDKLAAEILYLDVQKEKVAAEVMATEAQIINETQRTVNDTTRATNDTNRSIGELQALADKTLAEVALLEQKTETELAQVVDAVSTGTVYGVIGKQKDLFQKQTDGFDRDAEQKLAKIMTDTWSVRQTTDGADAGLAGIGETDIENVLKKAKAGIGAATYP